MRRPTACPCEAVSKVYPVAPLPAAAAEDAAAIDEDEHRISYPYLEFLLAVREARTASDDLVTEADMALLQGMKLTADLSGVDRGAAGRRRRRR